MSRTISACLSDRSRAFCHGTLFQSQKIDAHTVAASPWRKSLHCLAPLRSRTSTSAVWGSPS